LFAQPTDPAEAPKRILRQTIRQYKSLGLDLKPNKGDNELLCRCFAFEGLAGKRRWLGIKLKDDSFGRTFLEVVYQEASLEAWVKKKTRK
jgi:hypothetical protein